MVIINNTFEYKIHNTIIDIEGRNIIIDIEITNLLLTNLNGSLIYFQKSS